MLHLQAVKLKGNQSADFFPFNIPALQNLPDVVFTAPVTFLVGENGSGKSTFLEAIASAAGSITVGSEQATQDETLTAVHQLAHTLQLTWRVKTRKGFFLRAEDFFGFIRRLSNLQMELETNLRQVDETYVGRSELAKSLARMPYLRELQALKEKYGRHLHTYSHGESFLQLFQSRLVPDGLYLLDEPEAPLSPTRQLTLISMLKQMVAQNCQFIISTHSPLLMAMPQATILSFDQRPLAPVRYDELEHVVVTKTFLNNPEQYLRHL